MVGCQTLVTFPLPVKWSARPSIFSASETESDHPLKCVQRVVLLGGALGRMFGGSPQFLFVFYRPDRRENVRT